jgi:SET domain-containing protein
MVRSRPSRLHDGVGHVREVPIARRSRHHLRLRTLCLALMTRRIVARRSPIHGNGVFAVAPIRKGEEVIEYKGTLMSHAEADVLYGDGGETGHTFLFTLNDEYLIDANRKGNTARWINHSCDPNCQAVVEESENSDPRKDRVLIEAIRNIKPGEELTYDYGITLDVPHTARLKKLWECRCGSPKCSGTLLKSKR